MKISVWWGVKFSPGGHGSFFGFLNSGVHVVMYTYYMLAAFGPQVQKYLWWKKYLTILQMAQFVLVFTHAMQLFVHNPCQYPLIFAWLCILHALMFFVLFKGYYKKTYERIETTRRVKQ
ncbi:CLUMA_CG016315, isoform A [Clunio marinus]|uniref:Elongation of very long chain fatty acids protein n=1 Tax=Clunio marinus TaxID=568069 RepID=A0A1J1ITQ6_9DIPT|nr:CLUMA_CG016315, isoform A [Clunio marinus]